MKRHYLSHAKSATSALLATLIALTPNLSLAVNVQLQRGVNLRSSGSSVLEKVGVLRAGSVVSIPDEYAVRTNGSVNFELTLNNWLSKASQLAEDPGLKNFTATKRDFFFPIKVVKAAPGSQLGNQDSYMIALKYLQRKGSLLETTEDAPVLTSETGGQTDGAVSPNELTGGETSIASQLEQTTSLEAAAPAPVCLECQRQTSLNDTLPTLADRLRVALDSNLAKPLSKMTNRTVGHVNTTIARFEKTCYMKFSDFLGSLRQEITNSTLRTTVPNSLSSPLMLGLMTQETTGDCNAKGDHGRSRGAFQAQTTRYTANQLRNPITSARAAIDNLETQHQALAGEFDFSRMSETDRMRVLVSAYNGGPRWVIRAKDDLLQFNRQQGTNLDYNNWEHLRIFYFRRHLNPQNEYQMFGTVRGKEQRSTKNALNNLAYTENLLPRYQASNESTLQEAWHQRING